jgi:uncharacterized protein (TIGR02246 family)
MSELRKWSELRRWSESRRWSGVAAMAAAMAMLVMLGACSSRGGGVTAAKTVEAPDTRIADEAAIRAIDAAWAKDVATNDAEKSSAYYTDNATVMVPGQMASEGKDRITKQLMGMMSLPGFALTFEPETVVVARSGDMAYELGSYSMTLNDKNGTPQTSKAKYVVVWSKAADGTWKSVIDAPKTTR